MRLSVGFILILASVGCTRPAPKSSISIQMPDRSALMSSIKTLSVLPSNQKVCFGVNVKGEGISTASTLTCSGVGLVSGFVGEGETLVISDVPQGSKTFELMIYLTDMGSACPAFDVGTMKQAVHRQKLYSSGTASAVINGDTTVDITLNFPGESSSLAASYCGTLKAKLYSSGDLVDAGESTLAPASPTAEGFFRTSIAAPISLGVISSGGLINIAGDNLAVPGSVQSMTQKPDSGAYFGMRHDGSLVKLNYVGGTLAVEALTSATCPFATPDCKVPVWVQSISAGFLDELYGLDHAGTVHYLGASGPVATNVNVGPRVSQVSFY